MIRISHSVSVPRIKLPSAGRIPLMSRTYVFQLKSVPLDSENCTIYTVFPMSIVVISPSHVRVGCNSAVIRLQSGPSPAPLRLNSGSIPAKQAWHDLPEPWQVTFSMVRTRIKHPIDFWNIQPEALSSTAFGSQYCWGTRCLHRTIWKDG